MVVWTMEQNYSQSQDCSMVKKRSPHLPKPGRRCLKLISELLLSLHRGGAYNRPSPKHAQRIPVNRVEW